MDLLEESLKRQYQPETAESKPNKKSKNKTEGYSNYMDTVYDLMNIVNKKWYFQN